MIDTPLSSTTVSLPGATPSASTKTTGHAWDFVFSPKNAHTEWQAQNKSKQDFTKTAIANYQGFSKIPKPKKPQKRRNYHDIFCELKALYESTRKKDSMFERLFAVPIVPAELKEYDRLFRANKIVPERNKRTSACVLCKQVQLSRKQAHFSVTCSRCKMCPTCFRLLSDKLGPDFKCITRMVERAKYNRASQCAKRKGETL